MLNHLACVSQAVDANARSSYSAQPERMIEILRYLEIYHYCAHTFLGNQHMFMFEFSSYRTVKEHDGLLEDLRYWYHGFQDISTYVREYRGIEGKSTS